MGLSRWLEAAGIDPKIFRRVAAARYGRGRNFGEPTRVRSSSPAERADRPSASLDPNVGSESSGNSDGSNAGGGSADPSALYADAPASSGSNEKEADAETPASKHGVVQRQTGAVRATDANKVLMHPALNSMLRCEPGPNVPNERAARPVLRPGSHLGRLAHAASTALRAT